MANGPIPRDWYRSPMTEFWTHRRLLIVQTENAWQFDPGENRWMGWHAPRSHRPSVLLDDGRIFWPAGDGTGFLMAPDRNVACRLSWEGIEYFRARPGHYIEYASPYAVGSKLLFFGRDENEAGGTPQHLPETIHHADGGILTL